MASDGDYNKQHDEGMKRVLQIAFLKGKGPKSKGKCKHGKQGTCKSCTSNAKPGRG